jgi:C-3',4' desaturase CrtD
MTNVVIVGAGVGGLTTAAVLARSGVDVTVLEAHVDPGGCAATFYHQGFQFDAGATLAGGFYPGGPMDIVAQAVGIDRWPARPTNLAMTVHLPDGAAITRWTDNRRWDERYEAFGHSSDSFWYWQEQTADALWNLALRSPSWPPQTPGEGVDLAQKGMAWLGHFSKTQWPQLAADAFRPVAAHLRNAPERLRLFVDAQLLIAAQTTSRYANALYGASALDLPRRGVVHLQDGMGAIAQTLAQTVAQHGGKIHYRHEVKRIVREKGRPVAVETQHRRRIETFPADIVIANLPPWNIANLLGDDLPRRLRNLPPKPKDGWGAFMVYAGIDSSIVPPDAPLHHQIVVKEPLAEGNTVFLSLSPAWDEDRAPNGQRAVTLSTHTNLDQWWQTHTEDRDAYNKLKTIYTTRLLAAAEKALPGFRDAVAFSMPGTPVTFQDFTRRTWGWVGGFPQTTLFRAWGPRLDRNLWMVGDSIFPGQSTAAVALGGLRVARAVLAELDVKAEIPAPKRVTYVPPRQQTQGR